MGKKIVDKKKVDNGYLLPFDTKAKDIFKPEGVGNASFILRPMTKEEKKEYQAIMVMISNFDAQNNMLMATGFKNMQGVSGVLDTTALQCDAWDLAANCLIGWKELKDSAGNVFKYNSKKVVESFDLFHNDLKDIITARIQEISGLSAIEREVLG